MIKVVRIEPDGGTAPVITCDHCGKRIGEASDGNVEWKTDGGKLPEDGEIYFTHKHCSRDFERTDPKVWASNELTQFLRRLVHNVQADISENEGTKLLDQLP